MVHSLLSLLPGPGRVGSAAVFLGSTRHVAALEVTPVPEFQILADGSSGGPRLGRDLAERGILLFKNVGLVFF